jgi:high-affinity nickel-transport protein
MPDDPFVNYGRGTSFGVGMLHGIGAETPTQVLIFLAAAGAGGVAVGLLLLGCFIVGLLASNTLIALAATAGFLGATKNFKIYATVSLLTAGFSLVIGSLFLFGSAHLLPACFGG